MENKPYRTLLKSASDELVINKSRFICYGSPVDSEDEALGFLKKIRSEHTDASHNCYAYAIGPNMGIMRYSDDGEPGGTAGLPIMEVIKARGITNCILVITRYFGGVLLGAGGLVRAYSQSAALAINACGTASVYPTKKYTVAVSYSMFGKAEYAIKNLPVIVEDKAFTDKVSVTFLVKTEEAAEVKNAITTALDGKCAFTLNGESLLPWKD